MGRTPLLLFLSLLSLISVECVTFKQDFENQEIIRNIDLRNQFEIENGKYTIKYIGDGKGKSYILAYPPRPVGRIASVAVYSENEGETDTRWAGDKLRSEEVFGVANVPEGTRLYRVTLAEPLAEDETAVFTVVCVFIHGLKPFPAEITQAESQFVLYQGNAYAYSLYSTVTQTTVGKLASKKVEDYTKKQSTVEEDNFQYGPYTDVEPLSSDPIKVHFESNAPFATMKTMVKEIEVSHWGNVAVEETYLLHHTGAKLKGGFSRFDYQQSQARGGASFRGIIADLPASALDIYYRDEIGNISSSHVRHEGDRTVFEINPRYPLFGGWKIDFHIGYNIPSEDVLSTMKSSSNTYVLNVTFGAPFPMVPVDHSEVRVILPEGASNIKWSTPFSVESEAKDVRVTYLDTTGRPVLILKKSDLIGIPLLQKFQVTYSFSSLSMLKEPLLLIIAFGAFFLVSMVYVRIDLSISEKKEVKNRSRRKGSLGRLITSFCENGESMLDAYNSGNLADGDRFHYQCTKNLDEIAQANDFTSLAVIATQVLKAIKRGKKKLSSDTVKEYNAMVYELVRL